VKLLSTFQSNQGESAVLGQMHETKSEIKQAKWGYI